MRPPRGLPACSVVETGMYSRALSQQQKSMHPTMCSVHGMMRPQLLATGTRDICGTVVVSVVTHITDAFLHTSGMDVATSPGYLGWDGSGSSDLAPMTAVAFPGAVWNMRGAAAGTSVVCARWVEWANGTFLGHT